MTESWIKKLYDEYVQRYGEPPDKREQQGK